MKDKVPTTPTPQPYGEPLGEHMLACPVQPGKPRLTRIWNIQARSGERLGIVQWQAAWRRYVFHPDYDTLFDAGCLQVIGQFCAARTKEHKEKHS